MNFLWRGPATVRIRRGGDWHVRPNAEQIDGRTYRFRYGWVMDEDDPYPGEVAFLPDDPAYPDDGPTWVASGDLEGLPL